MKKILLMLAMMLPCLGAWAEIEVSNSVETPENTYSLLSKNGAYMSTGTGSTQYNLGRFAFYAEGENSYKIYSVDSKKWVSYNKADSYSDGANKATLVNNQNDAQAWNVVANGDYYNLEPYKNDGTVAGTYWNFHGGAGASGKTYIYDDGKTVGFYNQNGDGGSLWKLEKLTLATEEEVNAAKALIVVGPGYPKTTTSVYKAMNALTVGKSTTKHIALAQPAYQTATDIQLPIDGKAYKFTSHMGNLVKRYMNYTNGKKVSVSTNEADASVFVCKKLREGVYAFITEDGCILTWVGNDEGNAYKENNNIYGYSSYYATSYNGKSDWNEITVKKNGNAAKDLGYLRLVARRNASSTSSIIVNTNNRFDQANDGYWFNNTNSSAWILTEVAHTNTEAQNVALAKINIKNSSPEYLFGDKLGQYYAENSEGKVFDKSEVYAILDAQQTVENVNNTIKFNSPKTNQFIRIKAVEGWNDDAPYLGATNSTIKTTRAAYIAEKDANSIFLFDGNSLISYGSGNYLVSDNSNMLGYNGVQSIGSKVAFHASNSKSGAFNISFNNGNRWLYVHKDNHTDAGGRGTADGYNFIIEEVTELPVVISKAAHATFYAPVAVQVSDATAYTVAVNGDWATLTEVQDGVIPANTGVVLKGTEGTYNFTIASTDATLETALRGTAATTMVAESAYVLSAPEGVVGLYLANANPFQNNAFKAYLPATAVTSNAQALRFTFGGTTAIESVINNDANAPIYDLSGRRVMNAVKGGIYIQNGKKFIVK